MADETLLRDPNRITVNGGVTNDSDLDIVMFRVDPITKRLLISTALDKDTDEVLMWLNTAKDGTGTDLVPIVDTDGHFQVDVLSGGGAGEQYADNTVVSAAYKGNLALGTDGSNYQILAVDASGNLQVDILNASLAVTGTFWQATQPVSATDLDIRNLTNVDVVTAELSATDNAVLDVIAAKDFATQTTLALIKAKTDNIPALGQALAASSVPVILPAATITTLTPPAAITGFSTETTLAAINAKMVSGTDIGDVTINNASIAVTGAFYQATQPVSLASVPSHAVTNAGTFAVQAAATLAAETTKVIGTVNVAASQTIATTNAGTFVTQENGNALTALQLIDNIVGVEDAGETAGGGLAMAGSVRRDTPASSAGTTGDNATINTDAQGRLWVHPVPTAQDLATLATVHVKKYYTNAGAVTDGIIWSPAAGTRWFITDIYIQVSAAATVTLEDDLAGGDSPIWKAELAANSGWSHSFQTPWFSGEDAADLIITTTAGNVYVTCVGYEI